MRSLSNIEICMVIAEIEGVNVVERNGKVYSAHKHHDGDGVLNITALYNPLQDDGLCFNLMNKYSISLINHEGNNACYALWNHSKESDQQLSTATMTNPNLAVCLAIIELNKEK